MKKPIQLEDAVDLLAKEFGPQKWLIPGVIPDGVSLVASRPKLGKTFFSLNLAVGFCLGQVVFDAIQLPNAKVLYLFLEGTERSKQSRIRRLAPGGLPRETMLLAHEWSTGYDAANDLRKVLIDHPDVGLVIVDTLQRISDNSGAGNAYQKEYSSTAELVSVFNEHSVNALLIHHVNKDHGVSLDDFDSISGSYGIQGAVDNMIVLKYASDGSIDFRGRGRDMEETELNFLIEWPEGRWILNGTASGGTVSRERKLIEQALRMMGESAGPSAIFEQAKTLGYPSSMEALKKLLRAMTEDPDCPVTQKERGKYQLNAHQDSPPSPSSPIPKVSEVSEVSEGVQESSLLDQTQTYLFA